LRRLLLVLVVAIQLVLVFFFIILIVFLNSFFLGRVERALGSRGTPWVHMCVGRPFWHLHLLV
jgi:hypothetical protein